MGFGRGAVTQLVVNCNCDRFATLVDCPLMAEKGESQAIRAARSGDKDGWRGFKRGERRHQAVKFRRGDRGHNPNTSLME